MKTIDIEKVKRMKYKVMENSSIISISSGLAKEMLDMAEKCSMQHGSYRNYENSMST